MKGFKDLAECGKTRHGEQLKLYSHNGKFKLMGVNTCKKPCCKNCLPRLLKKQESAILRLYDYAQENNFAISMWTVNLPKKEGTSLTFQRKQLHFVISDFLRTSTRDSKLKPVNKEMKKINLQTQSVGYVYRNEVTCNEKFNPHLHLIDVRKTALNEIQKEELKNSLIRICNDNKIFISKKQEHSVQDTILNFKENFNPRYLLKIDEHDAVKLKDTDKQKYQEFCKSQIILNSKSNEKIIKIPLIYWKIGLKKTIGITENKFEVNSDLISVPDTIVDFMTFYQIEPKKLVQIVNDVGNIEILQNPEIFNLLST